MKKIIASIAVAFAMSVSLGAANADDMDHRMTYNHMMMHYMTHDHMHRHHMMVHHHMMHEEHHDM